MKLKTRHLKNAGFCFGEYPRLKMCTSNDFLAFTLITNDNNPP
jgi:hypothetical protein